MHKNLINFVLLKIMSSIDIFPRIEIINGAIAKYPEIKTYVFT